MGHKLDPFLILEQSIIKMPINKQFKDKNHQGVGNRKRIRVVISMPKGVLNPALISIIIIVYIISNQSTMTFMSARKNLANNQRADSEKVRSLVGLVAADPAPAPSPSPTSTRSATSGSSRGLPINGSIFGKRSVKSTVIGSIKQASTFNSNKHDSFRLEFQLDAQRKHQYNKKLINGNNNNDRVQKPQLSPSTRDEAANYKDIITEIIEDFLALNNESNSEEASVAFCRLIVSECNQLLKAQSKATIARRRRKKIQADHIAN